MVNLTVQLVDFVILGPLSNSRSVCGRFFAAFQSPHTYTAVLAFSGFLISAILDMGTWEIDVLKLLQWGENGVGGRREHVEEGVALGEESAEPTIWGGFHCYLLWPTSRSRWEGWDALVVIWANSVCGLVRYCKGWYQLVLCLNILPLVSGKYMVGGAFLPFTKIQELDRDMDSFSNTGLFGATCSYLLPPAHRSCLQWEDFHMAWLALKTKP